MTVLSDRDHADAPAPGGRRRVVTDRRPDLDLLPAADVVGLLLDAESRVVTAVRAAVVDIAAAADLVGGRFSEGGRLVFAGAGTSGRIAHLEAAELPGTFGLAPGRVRHLVAGGVESSDHAEDDLDAAGVDLAGVGLTSADVLIAVAASGSTPYTLAVADAARAVGAGVVAVTTVPGSPLAARADVAVEVVVGAEVLRGSSRLTAGTATKVALDALTTAAMARSGRVHGDHMIDVVGANAKLRHRVAAIVADVAGVDLDRATAAVGACDGDARAAVLVCVGALTPDRAVRLAAAHSTLRAALQELPGWRH